MVTVGRYLKVKELQDDFMVDGLLQKYDDSSSFMFGQVIGGNMEILNNLGTISGYNQNIVISFKRVAKLPYLNCYLVSNEDLIDVMTYEEYEELRGGK